MNTKISLIGAPTDIGAGSRGASMGPEALRVAHIATVLTQQGLDVRDKGKPGRPQQPLAAPGGRLPPSGPSHALEPGGARRRVC
jgi:arginase